MIEKLENKSENIERKPSQTENFWDTLEKKIDVNNTHSSISDCRSFWDKLEKNGDMETRHLPEKNGELKTSGDAVTDKINDTKSLNPEQLKDNKSGFENVSETDGPEEKLEGLTEEEKVEIKRKTGWSDEVIDNIGSMKEADVYINAGLTEKEIDGKKCLVRNDIDWDQKDAMGRTNQERAEQGLSPINKEGKVIELHHVGQHSDSPLAELTTEEHRGKGNDTILHNKTKESEIDRKAFATERNEHWEVRASEGGNQR